MEEEVIETSDAEELEEIRLIQEAQQNLSRRARFEPEPNSPRKRRKVRVSHDFRLGFMDSVRIPLRYTTNTAPSRLFLPHLP